MLVSRLRVIRGLVLLGVVRHAFVAVASLGASVLHAQQPKPAAAPATGIEGVVVDSAGRPLAGARLIVRDTARAGTAALRRQNGESDSTGRFRIVGLAPGAHVLEVQRDEYEPAGFRFDIQTGITAQVRIKLLKDPLWAEMQRAADSIVLAERTDSIEKARAAAAAGPAAVAANTFGKGSLVGRISTAEGTPVSRAQVVAMGTNFFTQTDTAGRFRLTDLPVGPYFLRARKVGYDPVVFGTNVVRGDSVDATITLTPFTAARGQRLDTVRVSAAGDRTSRRLQGFAERKNSGRGFFVDRAEIQLRRPQNLTDLLRGRANVNIQRNTTTGAVQVFGPRLSLSQGYCELALIIDGILIPNLQGSLDTLVPPEMVAGIEVYNSGTSVPSEFARLGTDCGAIIVWTR